LYCDAGFQLNFSTPEAILRFEQYLQLAKINSNFGFQLYDDEHETGRLSEEKYTKRETLSYLETSEAHKRTNQIIGGVMILQNNQQNRQLIQNWLQAVNADNHFYVTDELRIPQDSNFIAHINDQSIFSILAKKSGFYVIPDETYWPDDWSGCGSKFPLLAMRNSTGYTKFINPKKPLIDVLIQFWFRNKHKLKTGFRIIISRVREECIKNKPN